MRASLEVGLSVPQSVTQSVSQSLQEGAPFLGNGIWAPYTFRSYDKKVQKSPINICFVVCILIFAPYVYIELPLWSSRRELHFWAMGSGLLIHSGAITNKIPRSTINICYIACILVIAPYVYIELNVGSSRRELYFWAMGSGLLYTFRSYHKENSKVYDQYLLCRFHFSHCSLCIY